MKKIKLALIFVLTVLAMQTFAGDYSHLDPDKLVPKDLLETTLKYFDSHQSIIKKQNVIGIIDYAQHNSKKRFYILNMESGEVDRYLVAHGKGSDPKFTGYAKTFSNQDGTHASSLGFFITEGAYTGGNGYSLILDGQSSTNSNARSRYIVIHGADYVEPTRDLMGRSWGCPAVDQKYRDEVINTLKGGALLYAGVAKE